MQLEELVKDLATTILAVSTGLIFYNKIGLVGKLFLMQAFVYLLIDVIAANLSQSLWIYNLYLPVETILLFLAAKMELNTKRSGHFLAVLFITFLLIYLPELFFVKLNGDFVYISALTQYLFISSIYTFVLYERLDPSRNTRINLPIVIISFGLVVYSAGSIPCLAAMKELMSLDMLISKQLWQAIVVLLATLRYLLLAVGLALYSRRIHYNWF